MKYSTAEPYKHYFVYKGKATCRFHKMMTKNRFREAFDYSIWSKIYIDDIFPFFLRALNIL
jgi:hypothetical protein